MINKEQVCGSEPHACSSFVVELTKTIVGIDMGFFRLSVYNLNMLNMMVEQTAQRKGLGNEKKTDIDCGTGSRNDTLSVLCLCGK